jgi:putative Mg2+ transporter-C (MgtC) family protein
MPAELEIILRLGAATVIGAAIGLNRDLHGKPTGVRTLGLVGLGSALVILAGMGFHTQTPVDPNPVSRAIQGILTGIGFLGAGVIVREGAGRRVHGFTTAALIWLTACIGIACGLGAWMPAAVAFLLVFVLLVGGGSLEGWLHQKWYRADPDLRSDLQLHAQLDHSIRRETKE